MTVRRESQLTEMKELFVQLERRIQADKVLRHLNSAIELENFFRDVLNRTFKLELGNANSLFGENQDSFDLSDKSKRVAVQVTVTTSAQKIRKTLKGFVGKHDKTFDRLFFVYPVLKIPNSKANFANDLKGFAFDSNRDRCCLGTILREAQDMSAEEQGDLLNLIRIELSPHGTSLVKPAHALSNPLHRIINFLIKYHTALGHVHHADTNEARITASAEWDSCHMGVWGSRSVRDDTIRHLADPIKEWLNQIKCPYVYLDDFNLVEEGAHVLSGFAVSPPPMAMPVVYSKAYHTEDELWQQWNRQGDQYMALGGLITRLKELAARAGLMWTPSLHEDCVRGN